MDLEKLGRLFFRLRASWPAASQKTLWHHRVVLLLC